MPTIALVDDDKNILTSVSLALEDEGFTVRTYSDGTAALAAFQAQLPDLAVLDVKMPRLDGLELLQKLRGFSDMPIIFLTSKDDEVDEVLGLKLGADDYIRKPFSQRLLIERIRAVLRRSAARQDPAVQGTAKEDHLKRGALNLDVAQHLCSWRGRPINLTVSEFLILHTLAQHPGHVKSRDQLLDAAYSDDAFVDDRTIDSHIKRLRKKFRAVDPDFNGIETLYGVGYKFTA